VEYTPGHASHHVCFFDRSSGIAFVGDTAGVCVDVGYVLPPTPPPDIDVELWLESIQKDRSLAALHAVFSRTRGRHVRHPAHLQSLADNLQRSAALVRESLATRGPTTTARRTTKRA
jgi:glyoxylase-like metal-dependent hydrolase (beta-lactamase superfamily II)